MNQNNNSLIVVTHNGGYHADDVFACATLSLYFESTNQAFEIIRSRDADIIANADYVVDVGGEHTAESNRFDHHQPGGAGERDGGIPYAAFGLVWRHFGARLTEDQEITDRIDQKLVQPIDAVDNGIDITKNLHENIHPYTIHAVLGTFAPNWEEDFDINNAFRQAVMFAKDIITREIAIVGANYRADQIIQNYYEQSEDKTIIVISDHAFERSLLVANMTEHPEPLLIVYPHRSGDWHVATCRDSMDSFQSRISLPAEWGGLQGEELQEVSGVPDAAFCHQKLFLCGATTKDAALELAKLAKEKAIVS